MEHFHAPHHVTAEHALPHRLFARIQGIGQHGWSPSHDAVRSPSIERFRRWIPCDDMPVLIERVNRERRAFDDAAQVFVGVAEGRPAASVPGRDGTERETGRGKQPDVEEKGHRRAGYRLHHKRPATARGMADGNDRHRERRQSRTPGPDSEGGPDHQREQQVRVVRRRQEGSGEQPSECKLRRDNTGSEEEGQLGGAASARLLVRGRCPYQHGRSEHHHPEVVAAPPQAERGLERDPLGQCPGQGERGHPHAGAHQCAHRSREQHEGAHRTQVVELDGPFADSAAHQVGAQQRFHRVPQAMPVAARKGRGRRVGEVPRRWRANTGGQKEECGSASPVGGQTEMDSPMTA